jgi:two-component system sensor histidine kinase MtrB
VKVGPPALGLRRRIALSYGLGALLLSAVVALVLWAVVADYLQGQRTRLGTVEALSSAQIVQEGLARSPRVSQPLEAATSPAVEGVVRYGGDWYTSTLAVEPADLPDGLRQDALQGRTVRQRVDVRGVPHLVVGVPLDRPGDAYFAVLPLTQLDESLRVIGLLLAGSVVVTAGLAAGLGVWAANRSLRPLVRFTDAASAVARGDRSARLRTKDPDLAPLAHALNETAAELEERIRRDMRFAGEVSHELRSPVTTMANAVSALVARRPQMTPSAQEAVDVLQEEIDSFRRIADDLLEISIDDSGRGLNAELLVVAELVQHICERRMCSEVVDVRSEARQAAVIGDRRRLDRVVGNLVENADTHGRGLVRVAVEASDGTVRIVVEDAGPGVPPELRQRIFERFQRGAGTSRSESDGAGLGLALVARHVALHSGEVHVEERPGGGARFVVTLPTTGVPTAP